MATDTRGHTVPAADDAPARSDLLDLSLSLRDPIPVASTTARAQLITDLAALTPAITPSASNPVFVFRADARAGSELEYTTDGTTWRAVNAQSIQIDEGTVTVSTNSSGAGSQAATFEAGLFAQAPTVVAAINTGAGAWSNAIVRVTQTTTGGFLAVVTNGEASSSVSVNWIAVQK